MRFSPFSTRREVHEALEREQQAQNPRGRCRRPLRRVLPRLLEPAESRFPAVTSGQARQVQSQNRRNKAGFDGFAVVVLDIANVTGISITGHLLASSSSSTLTFDGLSRSIHAFRNRISAARAVNSSLVLVTCEDRLRQHSESQLCDTRTNLWLRISLVSRYPIHSSDRVFGPFPTQKARTLKHARPSAWYCCIVFMLCLALAAISTSCLGQVPPPGGPGQRPERHGTDWDTSTSQRGWDE